MYPETHNQNIVIVLLSCRIVYYCNIYYVYSCGDRLEKHEKPPANKLLLEKLQGDKTQSAGLDSFDLSLRATEVGSMRVLL